MGLSLGLSLGLSYAPGIRPGHLHRDSLVVIHIMHIIRIISIIRIILIIRIIFRFVKILDLQTTCGRTRGRWLPNPLITWAISFVLPCVPGGFPTSVVCTERRMVWPRWALLWEKAPWWSMIESTPLLDAASTVLPWWMMRLACNLQWIPTLNATFGCGIMRIIETIIAIIVT